MSGFLCANAEGKFAMSKCSPGTYLAKIQSAGFGSTPTTGTDFLQVTFTLTAIQTTSGWQPTPAETRNFRLWFSDKPGCAQRSIEQLRRWGFQGTDFAEIDGGALAGAEIMMLCKGLDAKGYEVWDAHVGSKPTVANETITKKLTGKWGGLLQLKGAAPPVRKPPTPMVPQTPAGGEDDDPIPF